MLAQADILKETVGDGDTQPAAESSVDAVSEKDVRDVQVINVKNVQIKIKNVKKRKNVTKK